MGKAKSMAKNLLTITIIVIIISIVVIYMQKGINNGK
jgi:hypothetical protein